MASHLASSLISAPPSAPACSSEQRACRPPRPGQPFCLVSVEMDGGRIRVSQVSAPYQTEPALPATRHHSAAAAAPNTESRVLAGKAFLKIAFFLRPRSRCIPTCHLVIAALKVWVETWGSLF